MKRSHRRFLSASIVGSVIAGAAMISVNSFAEDKEDARPIKAIMKVGFAGDKKNNVDSLTKVILSGKGTHETADELLKLCKELAAATPPKGDPENWKKRTADVVSAAEALDKGDMPSAEAIAAYKKASDCKSCHMEFRPPKKPA